MAESDLLREQNKKLDRDLKAALTSIESLNKELEGSKTALQAESVQLRHVIDSLSAQVQTIQSQSKDSDNRTQNAMTTLSDQLAKVQQEKLHTQLELQSAQGRAQLAEQRAEQISTIMQEISSQLVTKDQDVAKIRRDLFQHQVDQ